MGKAETPYHPILFFALLYKKNVVIKDVFQSLIDLYGPIEAMFGPVSFLHSEYYSKEMGTELLKSYIVFENYIQRDMLANIKASSNLIENQLLANGNRTVNIDPGYITRDKLVLASTKDFYHRIYLSQGIFAEVTLHYRHGGFRFFSWTYPDYKDPDFLVFLEKARAKLVKVLRS
jgi:hypothetical protein